MPDVEITREVSTDEVAEAVRAIMGADIEVSYEGTSIAVRQGFWKRAKVVVRSGSGASTVEVRPSAPPGLFAALIARGVNARRFAPEVAEAIKRGLG